MKQLFWKECRQNQPVLWVAFCLLTFPYALALCLMVWGMFRPGDSLPWQYCLWFASFYSIVLTQLAIALIGGNVIAGEKADRSAEFAAYLPVGPGKRLAAKLLLAAAVFAAVWLPNVPVHWFFLGQSYVSETAQVGEVVGSLSGVLITGLLLFCVAWLCSSVSNSPAISVALALLAPVVIAGSISLIARFGVGIHPRMHLAFVGFWYDAVAIPLAAVCFAVGTWFYLRRVEP